MLRTRRSDELEFGLLDRVVCRYKTSKKSDDFGNSSSESSVLTTPDTSKKETQHEAGT